MKTAIIYARVSDRKQSEEAVSVPSQIEAGQAKAQSLGASVLRVFTDDGRSAFTEGNRRSFEAAIDMAIGMGATYFITWSSARFARNKYEAIIYKRRLDQAGVKLIYLSTPIDRSTDEGWMADSFLEIVNELQSRQNAADTRRSMIRNAKLGYYCGGRVPYGYRSIPAPDDAKRRRLEVVPEEAAIVRQIFDERRRGTGAKRIAMGLNGNGIRCRGRVWSKAMVLAILRSHAVIGQVVFGRRNRHSLAQAARADWIVVPSHQPIVPADAWNDVQELLDAAGEGCDGGSPLSTHPFTGLLRCGRCGASLQIETARGRSAIYSYYRCSGAQKRGTCSAPRYRADAMDDWLSEVILSTVMTRETLRDVATMIEEECSRWASERDERRRAISHQLRDLQKRTSNLYEVLELHGKSAPNLGDLTQRLRANQEDAKRLEAQLAAIDAETAAAVRFSDSDLDEIAGFLREKMTSADSGAAARQFYSGFIRSITVGEKEITLAYDPSKVLTPSTVHSSIIWLPDLSTLRTITRCVPLDLRVMVRAA